MSGIWAKIMTALRGGVSEVGEAIVSNQALRILDQEIRDADMQMRSSRSGLANLMAKSSLAAKGVSDKRGRISELTSTAEKALRAGEEGLALEVAAEIGKLEGSLATESDLAEEYASNVNKLRTTLEQSEARIKALKEQVELVRTTEAVQKTHAALSRFSNDSTARLQAAAESLDAVHARQQETAARFEAQEQLFAQSSGAALEQKLRDANIIPDSSSAHAVLDRIKAKAECHSPHG